MQARSASRHLQGVSPSVIAVAAVVAVIQVVGSFGAGRGQPERESLDALAIVLLLAGPLALAARQRQPVAVLVVVLSVTLLYMVLGYPYGPVILSPIVAVFTAITSGHRLVGWAGITVLYAVHMVFRALTDDAPSGMELLGVGAWMLLILVGSEVVRAYRERAAETVLAQHEEARRRASDERLRIARELHDVLAHHISLMNVQASVALHLMDRKPEQARTALAAIEDASREAMSELRSVLDILHRPDDADAAPRAPAPGLDQLDALASRAEAAGLQVRLEVEGNRRPLRVPVEAAAYRVIQEAVTNVIRHASATTATVRLSYGSEYLTVVVEDDGSGVTLSDGSRTGSGIAGMRERVHTLGGEFEAEGRTGRGFRVRAVLPLGGQA